MPLKFDLVDETFECPVCGYKNHISAKACEKCKTIFPERKPLGGNMELKVDVKEEKRNVRSLIRSLPENYRKEVKARTKEEVIKELQLAPGITKENAERLYELGIHSLADLIYSMFVNQDVKAPERTALVYGEYIVVKNRGESTITCPFCKTKVDITLDKCPICAASMQEEILRLSFEKVSDGLTKFVKEIQEEVKKEGLGVVASESVVSEEVKKIELRLDELEEEVLGEEKKEVKLPELGEEKIKLDIEEIEKVEKEEVKKPSLDEVIGSLIEEEKPKKEEGVKEKISKEKYEEYRKRIEDWKAEGYDVSEIEKILEEKPEQFEELAKKIIIEQFRKRRAAYKKMVKK